MVTSSQFKNIAEHCRNFSNYISRYRCRADGSMTVVGKRETISEFEKLYKMFDNYSREMLVFEAKKQILLEKYPDMIVLFKEN